jgi:hypothetical protein
MSGRGETQGGADVEEPRRLLDDPDAVADPNAAWAVGLLRGAEPYRAPAGRKQRVQLRLGHVVRRGPPWLLRLAVASVVLFGGAAIVRAGLGHWPGWVTRAYERVVGPAPAARTAPARAHRTRHEAPAIARAQVDDGAEPEATVAPAIAAPVVQERPAPRELASASASRPRRASVAPAPTASEDTTPVSAAMRALRVDRNPARARALLARYLGEHPNGALAEEALALSIEAAIAHQDGDVAALANRYLRLYPEGSFQGLAREALAAKP